jgi:hypothetical protein
MSGIAVRSAGEAVSKGGLTDDWLAVLIGRFGLCAGAVQPERDRSVGLGGDGVGQHGCHEGVDSGLCVSWWSRRISRHLATTTASPADRG